MRGVKQAEVARQVSVSRQTISVLAKALSEDKQAWRRKPLGHQPRLGPAERKRLCKLLLKGAVANGFATELWTLRRIVDVIDREFGVSYGKTNVWLMLKAWGFSCQRPTGRATQRDEKAILEWQQKRWPMLKKKPAGREDRSFLSMRLD
jgi:transposase